MALVDLSLSRAYRSSQHRLGRDFLAHVLPFSTRYRRAAGFFASSVLGVASEEFATFFANGGHMELVCSPILSRADVEAMIRAVYDRPAAKAISYDFLLRSGRRLAAAETAQVVAGLIAGGRLEVRIALSNRAHEQHIYHEKIGILSDGDGQSVAFSGSANESAAAYDGNFERLDVFASFLGDEDRRRGAQIQQHFAELWSNLAPGVEVIPLDVALRRQALSIRESDDRQVTASVEAGSFPEELSSRIAPEALFQAGSKPVMPHQRSAIREWASAGGRGLLEMATGSGKTVTALSLASGLFDGLERGLVILIVAPLIHLVDQWREVAAEFGLCPVRCAGSRDAWYEELSTAVSAMNAGARPLLSIAVTTGTLITPSFQRLLRDIHKPMLLIADEAHNYGSPAALEALPQNAAYRLGLSATPERVYDEQGTEDIQAYFGPIVFRYGLKEALRDGVLTPYRYYPEVVDMTEEEIDEYVNITSQIVKYGGAQRTTEPSEAVKRLLIRRARLVATTAAKQPLLRSLLEADRAQTHTLVYCGDGSVVGATGPQLARQVDETVRMLNQDLGIRCNSYTAETPPAERRRLLEAFTAGDVQALVAIRCLDEGVDIPATRRAYMLASSTNPRQFIQRRGRVLRRHDGKQRADIHDFFVSFPRERVARGAPLFEVGRSLLRTQLARSREFAELAENGPIARNRLLEWRSHFDLLAEG